MRIFCFSLRIDVVLLREQNQKEKIVAKEGIEKMAARARRVNVRDIPMGAKAIPYIEEDIPLFGATVPEDKSENVSFTSIDGQTYRFGLKNRKGQLLPNRNALCVYLCLIEKEKGGSTSTVLSSFIGRIEDLDGKQVWPMVIEEPPAAVEEAPDFSLGADLSSTKEEGE